MISPNPTSPSLAPQAPQPTGKPARRGLRVAIVVIVLLAIISAVASIAPATISSAAHAYYPKPVLGTITLSGINGSNIPIDQPVQFSVQVQAGRDLSYLWDFGDSSGSMAANPTHTYTRFAAGLSVSVTVTDPIGQRATAALPSLTVLPPPPTASFVIDNQGCDSFSGTCTVFVDGSGSQAGDPSVQLSYAWDWGDGTSDPPSGDVVSEHQYSQAGTYSIRLTVTDQFGQSAETEQSVTFTAPVTATFTITNSTCDSNSQTCTVSVDASGSTGQGTLTYTWDWGDGTSNSTTTPQAQHVYTFQTGITYTITLTVTDSTGQQATYQQAVTF
jgi:PKD repeat protein